MKKLVGILLIVLISCGTNKKNNISREMNAAELLGNPDYQAICYGGYRTGSREVEPTIEELKEDMRILSALNIKMIRTYNVHHEEASNLLKAIRELKKEEEEFEMYVILGAWIDCKNAWTGLEPNHDQESDRNATEIEEAIRLTKLYPEIVKVISVGNEAMVNWAASYYVRPGIILKWVNYLQEAKRKGLLPESLWITSSDNFASWGGGDPSYHVEDLKQLIAAVDYLSVHTYPMHDTHYNPIFWGQKAEEQQLTEKQKVNAMMVRARNYAIDQYNKVVMYMKSTGVSKPVHIGETGWATLDHDLYGKKGSKATDEYKAGIYYRMMREWSNANGISCFYFEAFDEKWKDSHNPAGSENHFGLINLKSEAKYALWDQVDQGVFKHLKRDGRPIRKTYGGIEKALWLDVEVPSQIIGN